MNELSPLGDAVVTSMVLSPNEDDAVSSTEALETIAALTLCPSCGTSLGPGSVICTNCGYDFRVKTTLQVMTDSAPKKLIGSTFAGAGLLRPPIAGVAILGVYGLLAYVAVSSRSDGAVALFSAWHGLYLLGAMTALLVVAFRTSIVQGLLTLLVPFYAFYFVLGVTKNAWVRWLFAIAIAGIALSAIVTALTDDSWHWVTIPS